MSGRRWVVMAAVVLLVVASYVSALPGRRAALAFTRGVVLSDSALIEQTSGLGRNQTSLSRLFFSDETTRRPGKDFDASPVWFLPLRSAWRVTWADASPGGVGEHESVVVAMWTAAGWRVVETNTWFVD